MKNLSNFFSQENEKNATREWKKNYTKWKFYYTKMKKMLHENENFTTIYILTFPEK